MDKTVTIEQVLDWGPCYTREQVEELFDGRETMGWRDIAALPISAEHRCWALLHKEFLEERQLYLLGADIAELVLPIYEERYPGNPLPRNAIEVARQFARGEIDENQRQTYWFDVWFASRDESLVDAARSAVLAALWALDCNDWISVDSIVCSATRAVVLSDEIPSATEAYMIAKRRLMPLVWEQSLQIICRHLNESKWN